MAVAPSSTRAGVFGMTRISRALRLSRCPRSVRVATPAAIEMRSFVRSTAGAISRSTGPMIWGFTARMITSDSATRAELVGKVPMPYCFAMSARRSDRASVAPIEVAGTSFAWTSPLIMASPMLPAPRKPTRLCLMLTRRCSRGGPGSARTEDSRTHADDRGAFLDGDLVIRAHSHRKVLEPHEVAQLAQPSEVRPRRLGILGGRRNRHQPADAHVAELAHPVEQRLQVAGPHPVFLGLLG